MTYLEQAQTMIPTLTGLAMTIWRDDLAPLEEFEKKYCFLPQIQILYSVSGLLRFFEGKDGRHIYILTDMLETKAVIIKVMDQWVILGPYVSTEWQDTAARVQLAKNGAQESAFLPYKMYRGGLPTLNTEYVIQAAKLILIYTVGDDSPTEVEMINMAAEELADKADSIAKAYEETELINKRYAVEQKLSEAIGQGNTAEALRLRREIINLGAGIRFLSDEMQDHLIGAMGLRMLTRHAALRAGMTPVAIDAISQTYAQKMHRTVNNRELGRLCEEYLATFCAAVRSVQKSNYSLYVKRAVQYIEMHLNQQLDADVLSNLSNISRRHFAQLFSKETGKTVTQYVMQARCERAAELLQNSPLQIYEIGRYVGYEDPAYFSRVFRELMGVSPQQYRKMKSFY